jgi:hypothetical protein
MTSLFLSLHYLVGYVYQGACDWPLHLPRAKKPCSHVLHILMTVVDNCLCNLDLPIILHNKRLKNEVFYAHHYWLIFEITAPQYLPFNNFVQRISLARSSRIWTSVPIRVKECRPSPALDKSFCPNRTTSNHQYCYYIQRIHFKKELTRKAPLSGSVWHIASSLIAAWSVTVIHECWQSSFVCCV